MEYDVISGEITEGSTEGDITESGVVSSLDDEEISGEITEQSIDGEINSAEVSGNTEGIPFQNETDPTVPAWAKQEHKPDYLYEEIQEKPSINGVTLFGNKQLEDLNIIPLNNRKILEVWNNA